MRWNSESPSRVVGTPSDPAACNGDHGTGHL
jgi:hypothetical protein